MLVTPTQTTKLNENEIFVFGSNLAGRHGKGAAKQALQFGARYGQGAGLQGQTYAIPTKDKALKTLPLISISEYVCYFVATARSLPTMTFLVTPIGCGLAGYKPKDIAPLFFYHTIPHNVCLPQSFWDALD